MPEKRSRSRSRTSVQSAGGGTAVARAKARPKSYCSLIERPQRVFGPEVNPRRAELIRMNESKWANGTTLHYFFMSEPATFAGSNAQKQVVRKAFELWSDVAIGLKFEECDNADNAEIRIAFLEGDGAWSYVGRDVLTVGRGEPTMNFGWDLTSNPGEIDTAIHEIGHTLGFPHEHQNPNAGIVWDEEEVYRRLALPPNSWSRDKTFHNIIRKIAPDSVQGSNWDADSVMHYPFESGMIREPARYRTGLQPAGGLSARDKEWVRTFYPQLTPADHKELQPFESVQLSLAPAQQANFIFKPKVSRQYEIRTFGASDTVMVLFEEEKNGNQRYLLGDDDSGEDRNAYLKRRMLAGRKYIVRLRLYYADRQGDTGIMVW